MSKNTEKQIAKFELQIKKLEADTIWKIKDYETLLEQRPTMILVKQQIHEAGLETIESAANYTNEEINKLKVENAEFSRMFNNYKVQTSASLKEHEK